MLDEWRYPSFHRGGSPTRADSPVLLGLRFCLVVNLNRSMMLFRGDVQVDTPKLNFESLVDSVGSILGSAVHGLVHVRIMGIPSDRTV